MIEEIISLLKAVKAMGVTMVIASHDLVFLTQIVDRLIVLKGGKLIEDIKSVDFTYPIDVLKTKIAGGDNDY